MSVNLWSCTALQVLHILQDQKAGLPAGDRPLHAALCLLFSLPPVRRYFDQMISIPDNDAIKKSFFAHCARRRKNSGPCEKNIASPAPIYVWYLLPETTGRKAGCGSGRDGVKKLSLPGSGAADATPLTQTTRRFPHE